MYDSVELSAIGTTSSGFENIFPLSACCKWFVQFNEPCGFITGIGVVLAE
jgi:hypothetical protein